MWRATFTRDSSSTATPPRFRPNPRPFVSIPPFDRVFPCECDRQRLRACSGLLHTQPHLRSYPTENMHFITRGRPRVGSTLGLAKTSTTGKTSTTFKPSTTCSGDGSPSLLMDPFKSSEVFPDRWLIGGFPSTYKPA